MRKTQLVVAALLLLSLLVACAPKVAPASAPAGQPAWQAEWDKVLTAAKAEGQVVIHTTGSQGEREAMMNGMKQAYGIAAEATVGRGAELLPKFLAERKAGLYLNDMWVGGYAVIPLKAKAIVAILDSELVLPDVTDPERIKKVWYRGAFPWITKDHTAFVTTLQPGFPVAINSNLVKEGEIKSYRDLLNPKWKGKLVVGDPTLPGGPQEVWGAVMVIMGENFLRELVKTEPTVMRDQRLMMDWLAQGKVAMVFGPDSDTVVEFEKTGAPVKAIVEPAEGGYISASASGVAMFDRPAHPNAAKVFINWITSKEGQEPYVKAGKYHSLRLDVPTAHLDPKRTRQPGAKYLDVSSEDSKLVQESQGAKLAQEILGPLMKK